MAINKKFYQRTTEVKWDGDTVCTVRGLAPNDITQVMAENAADMETLMESFAKDKILAGVDVSQDDQLQAALEANTMQMFTTLVTTVPDLMAKIIAIAADDPDEWQAIKTKFVAPLQFNILVEIARLTFVDINGFKEFMGNALALAGVMKTDQRETGKTSTQPALSTALHG